jgi:hypothetical protein
MCIVGRMSPNLRSFVCHVGFLVSLHAFVVFNMVAQGTAGTRGASLHASHSGYHSPAESPSFQGLLPPRATHCRAMAYHLAQNMFYSRNIRQLFQTFLAHVPQYQRADGRSFVASACGGAKCGSRV